MQASEIELLAAATASIVVDHLRPRRLIGHDEVAELLGQPGAHRTTVNRWAREGRIPKGVLYAGSLRWREDEIAALIERLPRQGATPEDREI